MCAFAPVYNKIIGLFGCSSDGNKDDVTLPHSCCSHGYNSMANRMCSTGVGFITFLAAITPPPFFSSSLHETSFVVTKKCYNNNEAMGFPLSTN